MTNGGAAVLTGSAPDKPFSSLVASCALISVLIALACGTALVLYFFVLIEIWVKKAREEKTKSDGN